MKLWKENKIDQEYELSHKEIIEGFKKSSYYKRYKNPDDIDLDYALRLYITSKDGLNSIFGKYDDFDKLYEYAREEVK